MVRAVSIISLHVGTRRDADENPLLRAELLLDAVALQIVAS